ncbi:MAG: sugar ABC transporter permease [Chloroflexota bacterium]
MASESLPSQQPATADADAPIVEQKSGLLSGRKRRDAAEALLAYALLFPALLIIFVFGIFPLGFSIYESTLTGLNKIVGRYTGLDNYVKAIGNLAYVLAFWIAAVFIYLAFRRIQDAIKLGREREEQTLYWVPAAIASGTAIALAARFVFTLLPHMLRIPEQIPRGQELTPELFRQLLGEAWRMPDVQSALWAMLIVGVIAIALIVLTNRLVPHQTHWGDYLSNFMQSTLFIIGAAALGYLAFTEVQKAYTLALETGESPTIWTELIVISAGAVLLILSYLLWRGADQAQSTTRMLLRIGGALALAIGAWVFIAELPAAIAAGNDDWWESLLNTVYFAMFTIPLQFGISLAMASILFMNLRGQSTFRVIYFLPYIAPLVGTAAAFRIIFSARANAPINSLLTSIGLQPLSWLNEPTGIFQMMLGKSVDLPIWLAGPSLALFTIVLYNVWAYVGFDIVIFLAGLGNIPNELYEAASIDGSGRWQQFRHITLPMLSPTIYFLMLLAVIGTFKAFNHIYVLREGAALGTTDTASVLIFQTFNRDTRYGYASALAILLLIIVTVLTVINNKVGERRVFYG